MTDEQKKTQKKSVDGRDDLLDQIRSGVTLKKVELDNKSEGNSRLVVLVLVHFSIFSYFSLKRRTGQKAVLFWAKVRQCTHIQKLKIS